jgi:hypothetical protein
MLYHVSMSTTLAPIARTTGEPDHRFTDERKESLGFRARPSFRREIDAFAEAHGMRRTRLIEEALRFYMAVKAQDGIHGR